MSVTVKGLEEVHRDLRKYEAATLRPVLQKATDAGGKVLAKFARQDAPKVTGRMRKKTASKRARRERPASVVSSRVFYSHFVQRGTKAHRIRFHDQVEAGVPRTRGNIRHPGSKADPFIERNAIQHGREVIAAADAVLDKELGL